MRVPISYSGKYVQLWQKYRPVILNMMIASSKGPQEYKLSSHEFVDINKRKTGYSFALKVFQCTNKNNIEKSLVAQDLLYILKCSNKAQELTDLAIYNFELDRNFVLHITSEPHQEMDPVN